MTRGVYVAWLWVLGIALGLCALAATLGAFLRLEGPTPIDCTETTDSLTGHVRFEGCMVDATEAFLVGSDAGERAAVWIVSPDWTGRPYAWTLSEVEAHLRWARERRTLDEDARRRYLDRHRDELRSAAPVAGWLVPDAHPADGMRGQTLRPAPRLSLDRPLEPLAVGGSLAAALLLVLLLALVARRRRWREAQDRWAHERGVAVPGRSAGQPRAF